MLLLVRLRYSCCSLLPISVLQNIPYRSLVPFARDSAVLRKPLRLSVMHVGGLFNSRSQFVRKCQIDKRSHLMVQPSLSVILIFG